MLTNRISLKICFEITMKICHDQFFLHILYLFAFTLAGNTSKCGVEDKLQDENKIESDLMKIGIERSVEYQDLVTLSRYTYALLNIRIQRHHLC